MKIIRRERYLHKIKNYLGLNLIICLTGQRRVGKTCLLRSLAEQLSEDSPESNIVFIDKEKDEFDSIKDYHQLNKWIDSQLQPDIYNYIIIDEVQMIDGFEKSLCNYYDRDNVDVIISGSNAKMFSSELSTLLSGRYTDIHVHSLSYREYLEFHQLEDNDSSLLKYLTTGGLPNIALLPPDSSEMVQDYLTTIFNTIVVKDIVAREMVRNVTLLENLAKYIADNTGKLFSATNLSNFLKKEDKASSSATILNYIKFLTNAYIINKVPRYELHGKQLLTTNEKYYFEDLGLRNCLTGGRRATDIEKVIENAVYLHLRELGYTVWVGVLRNGEIDFVARKGAEQIYIQATYLLAEETTIEREFGNLLKIKDNYPKYVVSMDPFQSESNYEGVRHLHLRTFLNTDHFE